MEFSFGPKSFQNNQTPKSPSNESQATGWGVNSTLSVTNDGESLYGGTRSNLETSQTPNLSFGAHFGKHEQETPNQCDSRPFPGNLVQIGRTYNSRITKINYEFKDPAQHQLNSNPNHQENDQTGLPLRKISFEKNQPSSRPNEFEKNEHGKYSTNSKGNTKENQEDLDVRHNPFTLSDFMTKNLSKAPIFPNTSLGSIKPIRNNEFQGPTLLNSKGNSEIQSQNDRIYSPRSKNYPVIDTCMGNDQGSEQKRPPPSLSLPELNLGPLGKEFGLPDSLSAVSPSNMTSSTTTTFAKTTVEECEDDIFAKSSAPFSSPSFLKLHPIHLGQNHNNKSPGSDLSLDQWDYKVTQKKAYCSPRNGEPNNQQPQNSQGFTTKGLPIEDVTMSFVTRLLNEIKSNPTSPRNHPK